MRLLAIETSSPRGSLCLCEIENGNIKDLTEQSWEKQSSHSEVISELLIKLLRLKSWQLKDLTHIATGIGPGSFTGIRVGLNFAKSLAYGLKLPILAVNSLEALAMSSINEPVPTLCAVNAFKNQIFAASYNKTEVHSPQVVAPQELGAWLKEPHLCRGDAFDIYQSDFNPALLKLLIRNSSFSDFPQASDLALKISLDFSRIKFSDWKSVNPLYIRTASAEEKLNNGSLKPLPRF